MDLRTLYTHQTPRSRPSAPTSTAMSHSAFFYGTLMAAPVLHRVIWGSPTPPTPAHAALLSIRPALLPAHQRRHVKAADYPAVTPSTPESEVRGTLVQGLTDGDIWRLDIFEGGEYERRDVVVRVLGGGEGEGEEVRAQTYIWIAGEQRLESGEWDYEHFVREKMGRWVGGNAEDEGLRDVDEAVKALGDPTGGRGANGDIARRLEGGKVGEREVLDSAV